MSIQIRDATADDLPAINDIYNYYVLNTTSTFHETAVTPAEREQWCQEHGGNYAVLVAIDGRNVIGWASLSRYSGRCAYRFTAENSIYLAPTHVGRGIGRSLLAALIERARHNGFRSIFAAASAEQPASLALHRQLGYREVGRLNEVGYKFGRWISVVLMQRMLP
jgi:phosphinothricin acetyltransferase